MLEALEFLHGENVNIIHRDIRPENILFDTPDHFVLAEFSHARRAHPPPHGDTGYLEFMPPEMYDDELQTTAVDIWSLGAVCLNMIACLPLTPLDRDINSMKEGCWCSFLAGIAEDVEAKPELAAMIRMEPSERLSASQLREFMRISSTILVTNFRPSHDLLYALLTPICGSGWPEDQIRREVDRLLRTTSTEEHPISGPAGRFFPSQVAPMPPPHGGRGLMKSTVVKLLPQKSLVGQPQIGLGEGMRHTSSNVMPLPRRSRGVAKPESSAAISPAIDVEKLKRWSSLDLMPPPSNLPKLAEPSSSTATLPPNKSQGTRGPSRATGGLPKKAGPSSSTATSTPNTSQGTPSRSGATAMPGLTELRSSTSPRTTPTPSTSQGAASSAGAIPKSAPATLQGIRDELTAGTMPRPIEPQNKEVPSQPAVTRQHARSQDGEAQSRTGSKPQPTQSSEEAVSARASTTSRPIQLVEESASSSVESENQEVTPRTADTPRPTGSQDGEASSTLATKPSRARSRRDEVPSRAIAMQTSAQRSKATSTETTPPLSRAATTQTSPPRPKATQTPSRPSKSVGIQTSVQSHEAAATQTPPPSQRTPKPSKTIATQTIHKESRTIATQTRFSSQPIQKESRTIETQTPPLEIGWGEQGQRAGQSMSVSDSKPVPYRLSINARPFYPRGHPLRDRSPPSKAEQRLVTRLPEGQTRQPEGVRASRPLAAQPPHARHPPQDGPPPAPPVRPGPPLPDATPISQPGRSIPEAIETAGGPPPPPPARGPSTTKKEAKDKGDWEVPRYLRRRQSRKHQPQPQPQ